MIIDLRIGWLHVHVQFGPSDDPPKRESSVDALVERASPVTLGFTPRQEEDY